MNSQYLKHDLYRFILFIYMATDKFVDGERVISPRAIFV
jgi:hypothetical protein